MAKDPSGGRVWVTETDRRPPLDVKTVRGVTKTRYHRRRVCRMGTPGSSSVDGERHGNVSYHRFDPGDGA